MEKVSKESVLYVFNPETQYQCKDCLYNKEPEKCAQYGPAESIKAYGSCGEFKHSTDPELRKASPWIGLTTKERSGYMENEAGFSCKRCEYLMLFSDCQKVNKNSRGDTPKIIHPNACCNAWDPDKVRSKITTEEFQAAGKSSWYRQLLRKSG